MHLLMSTILQWERTMSHFNEIFCNWCRRPMTPDSRVSTKVSDTYTRHECVVCTERSKQRVLLTFCRWCGADGRQNPHIRRYGYCHTSTRTCWKESSDFRIFHQYLEGDELAKKMPDIIAKRFAYLYRKNGITLSGKESVSE